MKTAQILIIGDEILSGRTADTNSHFLAKALHVRGVRTERIHVIPDVGVFISQWVRHNHALCDFLFICGGIGGTPDDVTRQAVADGVGVPLVTHPMASQILLEYYKEKVNSDRMRMAELPEGCTLIDNPITKAPGFKIKNIYVFAGIPKILYAMFETIKDEIQGTPLYEAELYLSKGEGEIAKYMVQVNKEFPLLELGSYPSIEPESGYRTQLVFRAQNQDVTIQALARFKELCENARTPSAADSN